MNGFVILMLFDAVLCGRKMTVIIIVTMSLFDVDMANSSRLTNASNFVTIV